MIGLLAGASVVYAQKPTTVIHVINVKWKADAKPEQIKAALAAAEALPAKYPGIKRVWTKNIKFQMKPDFDMSIVMEFENEAALQKYADSPAQKEFYKAYLPIREESRTNDITN
jgi:antibiotic biosynthesis monooxygenase (ABM) superfamily enzyme